MDVINRPYESGVKKKATPLPNTCRGHGVSGIFDFTHVHVGDDKADLVQSIALYLDKVTRLMNDSYFSVDSTGKP